MEKISKFDRMTIWDSLLILVNLSLSYSVIPYLLFFGLHRFLCGLIVVIINTVYVGLRFGFKVSFQKNPLMLLFVLIGLVNLCSAIVTNTGWQAALTYTVVNISFFFLLGTIYVSYVRHGIKLRDRVYLISRGYIWLAILCVISCVLLFVLVKIGINPYVNNVNAKYDLFTSNVEKLGADYYFPYHLGLINDSKYPVRIPFFQEKGVISGIYHEPHIATFMLFPAFLLMLYFAPRKKRWIVIVMSIFIMLLEGSTTNIICSVLVLLAYWFYLLKDNLVKSLELLTLVAVLSFLCLRLIDSSNFMFIVDKLGSSSVGYSQTLIEYAFTPKTLLGSSMFDNTEVSSFGNALNKDVGYIKFFINIGFLLCCFYYLFKLFCKKDKLSLAVLMSSLYFFAHSTKVAMTSYSLTMLIFFCFIMYEALRKPIPGEKF